MVSVKKSDSVEESVIRAVDEAGLVIEDNSSVFIKVDARDSEGTSPEVLTTLIKICRVKGAAEVIVGDRLDDGDGHLLTEAARSAKAEFVDLRSGGTEKVRSKGAPLLRRGFKLPLAALKADAVILAPHPILDDKFGFLGALASGWDLLSSYDRFKLNTFGKKVEKTVEVQSALNVVLTLADLTKINIAGQTFTPRTVIAGKRIEVDTEIHALLKSFGASLPADPGELTMIAHAKQMKVDAGSTDIGLVRG